MKITKSQLREIIREEITSLTEIEKVAVVNTDKLKKTLELTKRGGLYDVAQRAKIAKVLLQLPSMINNDDLESIRRVTSNGKVFMSLNTLTTKDDVLVTFLDKLYDLLTDIGDAAYNKDIASVSKAYTRVVKLINLA